MPVESKKQWGWLAINRPDLLHKWQTEVPVDYSQLPDRHASDRNIHKYKKRSGRV